MKSSPKASVRETRWIRGGIFLLTLFLAVGIEALLSNRGDPPWIAAVMLLLALTLAGLASWLAGRWLEIVRMQEQVVARMGTSENRLDEVQKRLTTVLQINACLADAADETGLMEAVLGFFTDLTGATGSTYVPLDSLGQPLALVHQGTIPAEDLKDWSHLALSTQVQQRCAACQLRHASADQECPLHRPQTFGETDIYCLPLDRDGRILGMLNLYLPPDHPISSDLGIFLESLLGEIALAIDSLRLRNQETATLRQLQMVHSPKQGLDVVLQELLENTQQALEADYAMVRLAGDEHSRAVSIFGRGESNLLAGLDESPLVQYVLQNCETVSEVAGSEGAVLPDGVGSVLAAPMAPPDAAALGVMLIANQAALPFYPRQRKVLMTFASQAAVLIENQRFLHGLEYRAVMDERTRLAREIHDGLAQTLAFLKLQVSQMQTYLKHGDIPRLQEAVEKSYATLSGAYVDTRQAIDNLRMTPQESMRAWLTRTADDFTGATHIKTRLAIQTEPDGIPDEVQAQLLRVVQEALSNIRKHAHARNVTLALHRWEGDLILEIRDDGQGFYSEDVPSISQYGLKGMRERAELIGADFQIISALNKGTTIRLRLPKPLEETPV